jgi:hypothetical protein
MPARPTREPSWLLLIHQIPPKPNYLRIKIGRHLQRLGAVGIKNSVYALPTGEQAREDLNWVLREVVKGGGDASLVEATFVEGLTDVQVQELFRAARDTEYQRIAEDARQLAKELPRRGPVPEEDRAALHAQLVRLQKRVTDVAALDFFEARGREPAEGLLRELAERLAAPAARPRVESVTGIARPRGAVWVTRTGVHVDRMASAWLIRRFIDGNARFKFVSTKDYLHERGELRFDMFDGEFTHEGDLCTFEVLMARFSLEDRALEAIAQLVHDIDLKDDKHGLPEKAGIERLVNSIALAHGEDEARLDRAAAMFDDLYEGYRRKRR